MRSPYRASPSSPGKFRKAGVSSNLTGKDSASFPEGFTFPNNISAIAPAPAWPTSQLSTIPFTSFIHGIATALPLVRTTTVFC